jgi:hypothetical protein
MTQRFGQAETYQDQESGETEYGRKHHSLTFRATIMPPPEPGGHLIALLKSAG